MIIDIEGNSREDGPGIRSVVFFKGCLLNCLWCQNPESKKSGPELWWDSEKCLECGDCIEACPQNAISQANPHFIDRSICDLCFQCEKVCAYNALRRVGKAMSVEEIIQRVLRYKPFFDMSGGGVTLSGGEPTLYMEFASLLLSGFKQNDVHTLIETAGQFDFEQFTSMILPFTDVIYFDIKMVDSAKHKSLCGVGSEVILQNFVRLHDKSKSEGFEIIPRTPLIPGLTDQCADIESLAKFYQKHQVRKTVVLPSNPAWIQKLGKIGQCTLFDKNDPIHQLYNEHDKQRVREQFSKYGIEVVPAPVPTKT